MYKRSVAAMQEAPLSHQCRLSRAGVMLLYLQCCCSHVCAAVSVLLSTFKFIHFSDCLNEKGYNCENWEISYICICVRWQRSMLVTGHMHSQKQISNIANTLCPGHGYSMVQKLSYPACVFDEESEGASVKAIFQPEPLQVVFYQFKTIHSADFFIMLFLMTADKKRSHLPKHNRLSIQIKLNWMVEKMNCRK